MKFFNKDKCQQRRRVAATRLGLDAALVKFLAGASLEEQEKALLSSAPQITATEGALPETTEQALEMINALLPDGTDSLSADDVYIHLFEAANDNFVSDRYMFMGESTLRNIAKGAATGIAFMNSHRDGGLSAPAELPFGKTFAGQYQEGVSADGRTFKRAIVASYMLRGIYPNGTGGPSTDDLNKMINGGQVADVSVGLYGGDRTCDVCQCDLKDCNHYPGTTYKMSDEQIEAQKAKGVKKGRASYTYNDGQFSELSGVYDGAVPGAGARKVFQHRAQFAPAIYEEALDSFGPLLEGGESAPVIAEIVEAVRQGVVLGLEDKQSTPPNSKQHSSAHAPVIPNKGANKAMANNQDERANASEESVEQLKEQLRQATAQAEQAAKDAQAANARAEKLEKDARRERFTRQAENFVGGPEAHVDLMEFIADKSGEDSTEFKKYVENASSAAAQRDAGQLFSEKGRTGQNSTEQSVTAQAESKAKALMEKDSSLSYNDALTKVFSSDSALYARYQAENTVKA